MRFSGENGRGAATLASRTLGVVVSGLLLPMVLASLPLESLAGSWQRRSCRIGCAILQTTRIGKLVADNGQGDGQETRQAGGDNEIISHHNHLIYRTLTLSLLRCQPLYFHQEGGI